ncbi:MAG TPA: methylenetetrahydrofolate reductase [Woeseiaceae bacterium]|nr:methylenetetrahydrofolate reductase [Woeseiaceae bacterium]
MKTFRDAVRDSDFVITAQLPLGPGTTAEDLRQILATLQPVVDAVQVSDNPTTKPHMAPLAAAALSLQAGIDPIVHMTCRDRNRIALQSDVMGAAALGVTSLILSRGEKMPGMHKQRIKGVFDIGAKRLLATAQAVAANERLISAPGFFLGSNVTVIDPPEGWAAEGIDNKAGAGSKFVQTQPCLDIVALRKYMAALVARKALERVSVIVQVPLLQSLQSIDELQGARRPLLIPPALVERLRHAKDFCAEAEAVCSETLQALPAIPGIAGSNITCPGDPVAVLRVLTAAFGNLGRSS